MLKIPTSRTPVPDSKTIAQLAEEHLLLRRQIPWLLGVGLLLGLVIGYQWLVMPSRASFTGYQLRQVGVQANQTPWILAYLEGKAELLFQPAGPSNGWQRQALGLDTAEASALSLGWGSKALLVGSNGRVRIYDSLLRPADTLQLSSRSNEQQKQQVDAEERPAPLPGRAVVVDKAGLCAIVIGDNGQLYATSDGGRNWHWWQPAPKAGRPDTIEAGIYLRAENTSSASIATHFLLASRHNCYILKVITNRSYVINMGNERYYAEIDSVVRPWSTPLAAPVAWCGLAPDGVPWAIDRNGNWARPDTAGSSANAGRFFNQVLSAALLDSAGTFLGISSTQLYQHKVVLSFVGKTLRSSNAGTTVKPSPKPKVKLNSAKLEGSQRRVGSGIGSANRSTVNEAPTTNIGTPPADKKDSATMAPHLSPNATDKKRMPTNQDPIQRQQNPAAQQASSPRKEPSPKQSKEMRPASNE